MRTKSLLFLPLLFFSVHSGVDSAQEAFTLFTNGKIHLLDDAFTVVQALAARDGKVLAVGTDREILKLKSDGTEVIDLGGKTVIPGFNDVHTHVRIDPPWSINLISCRSVGELLELVRAKTNERAPGQWITGWDWAEDDFLENRIPTIEELDAAAPNHPVVLIRAGGHSSIANSPALKIAGVDRSSPDPPKGIIDKSDSGDLTGWMRESAQGLVWSQVPDASPEDIRAALIGNLNDRLALGITSYVDASVPVGRIPHFQTIYSKQGERLPRGTLQIRLPISDGTVERAIATIRRLPFYTGFGNDRLKIGALKVFVDGGYTGGAAYTLEPYKGRPDYFGILSIQQEELTRVIREGHARNWQFGIHAIGDGAVQVTIDAFDTVLTESPRENHRHYLNHMSVKPPDATLRRMASLGIGLTQQPNFTYTLEGPYNQYLEGERLETNNPVASVMAAGVRVALSNDSLPTGPLVAIYGAVTRKGKSGRVYGPGEAITMKQAVRAFTRDAAYVTFDEDVKGTLEPGMFADMAVLSDPIFLIDPNRILDIKVEKTIVGGRVVYERN